MLYHQKEKFITTTKAIGSFWNEIFDFLNISTFLIKTQWLMHVTTNKKDTVSWGDHASELCCFFSQGTR